MHYVKAIGRWIAFFVFHMAIIFLITTASMYMLFGDRDSIKSVMDESGIYDQFIDSVLTTAANESQGQEDALPFGDEKLQQIANETFSPTVLKNASEQVIDAVYDWAEGSTDTLIFEVNLQPQADTFIERLSNYAVDRYNSLPDCGALDRVNVTVFNITCKPAGSTPEIIKQASIEDLQQVDLINSPVYSDEDLFSEATTREDVAFVPTAFKTAKIAPYLTIAVVVVAGIIYVLLHRSKRRGVKRLGRDLLTNALFIAMLTVVFGFLLPKYTDTFSIQGEGIPRLLNNVVDVFLQNLDIVVINIALVLGSAGATILIIERMSRPENLYAGVDKKSGLSSSSPKRKKSTPKNTKKPPLQTSEAKKKKTTRRKNKKYRKIGL